MPGRYQTGSIAILTTETLPFLCTTSPSCFSRPAASALCSSGRSRRARVMAMVGRMSMPSAISRLEILRDQMAPRIERDDALRIAPLRKRPDGRGGMGVGEIRAPDRIERAGRDRKRAIDRIGAAMGADHVAVLRPRHRADDRSAFARAGRAPVDGKLHLRPGTGCEVSRIWSIRFERFMTQIPKGIRPAVMTGRTTSN